MGSRRARRYLIRRKNGWHFDQRLRRSDPLHFHCPQKVPSPSQLMQVYPFAEALLTLLRRLVQYSIRVSSLPLTSRFTPAWNLYPYGGLVLSLLGVLPIRFSGCDGSSGGTGQVYPQGDIVPKGREVTWLYIQEQLS